MIDHSIGVAEVITLSGGELVGKTRLQKTIYFLEARGIGYGFDFDYHYYGPYSEELSIATSDAKALGYMDFEWKYGRHPYVIFSSKVEAEQNELAASRKKVLSVLGKYDPIVLELAATADYLKQNGFENDPWAEVSNRKGDKVSAGRVARAKELLLEVDEALA